MTTKTKKKPAPSPLQVARTAMRHYVKTKNEKAALEEKQRKAKAILEQFAKANRKNFDENDNFKLPGGYLHFGEKSVIKPCQGFDLSLFVKEFPELVDQKFKTAAVKNLLESEEGKEKLLANHCVELDKEEQFEIVVK